MKDKFITKHTVQFSDVSLKWLFSNIGWSSSFWEFSIGRCWLMLTWSMIILVLIIVNYNNVNMATLN